MGQRAEYMKNHRPKEDPIWEGSFQILRESEKAYLLWDGTGTTANAKWVPRSQIISINATNSPEVKEVVMNEWIAKEKGFL